MLESNKQNTGAKIPLFKKSDTSEFAAKRPADIGAMHHDISNRGNIASWLIKQNVILNYELWNKFKEKPAGLEHIPKEQILKLFTKGLKLGYI
jgi:hypothetical protein